MSKLVMRRGGFPFILVDQLYNGLNEELHRELRAGLNGSLLEGFRVGLNNGVVATLLTKLERRP